MAYILKPDLSPVFGKIPDQYKGFYVVLDIFRQPHDLFSVLNVGEASNILVRGKVLCIRFDTQQEAEDFNSVINAKSGRLKNQKKRVVPDAEEKNHVDLTPISIVLAAIRCHYDLKIYTDGESLYLLLDSDDGLSQILSNLGKEQCKIEQEIVAQNKEIPTGVFANFVYRRK